LEDHNIEVKTIMYDADTPRLEVRVKELEDRVKKLEEAVYKKSVTRLKVKRKKLKP
jgi:hypothetical protein